MATAVAPNNSPAPTTNYGQAYNEVGNQFTLPMQQVQQEQAQALTAHNTNLGTLAADQKTSLSSLDQAKANAFTTIGNNANAKGVLFSGYQPYENGQYVQNTYNPNVQKVNTAYTTGVANENTNYGNTTQSLQDKIAQINQDRANAANSLVLNTKAAQVAAANKAASAAKSAAAKAPSKAQIVNAISQGLNNVKGGDGYVSPQDYATAYKDWIQAGQSASSFGAFFKQFQNPNNGYYTYAEKQVT